MKITRSVSPPSPLGNNLWKVGSHIIYWKSTGGRCDCKGFQYTGWCKHLEAVKVVAPGEERQILDEC